MFTKVVQEGYECKINISLKTENLLTNDKEPIIHFSGHYFGNDRFM